MRANKIVAVLAAAWMATAAQATMITADGYDNSAGMMVNLNVNGSEEYVWAGPFLIGVDGGPATFDVFCLDFFTTIDNHATYSVDTNPPAPGFYEIAGQMYSSYIANMANATGAARNLYGAALQIALWEVQVDGFDLATANDLDTGLFRESAITPFNIDLHNIVTSYLTSVLGPIAPGVTIYQSASKDISMQTLIGGGSGVPEPGTWAMLGSGLVGLGLMRRRKV